MAPEPQAGNSAGPLSPAELAELEATLLPALERHHLRLLAHGLRTLQAIASEAPPGARPEAASGTLPDAAAIRRWAAGQPAIAADSGFLEALSGQLEGAGRQLAELGAALGRPPLALSLQDLIAWAIRQADQRTKASPPATPAR